MTHGRRYLIIAVTIIMGIAASRLSSAQTNSVDGAKADEASLDQLYVFQFHHIQAIDAIYAQRIAENPNPPRWRDPDQIRSGLTEDQMSILHGVALACLRKLKQNDDQIGQIRDEMKAAMNAGTGTSDDVADIQQLVQERRTIVRDAVTEFRAKAGEQAFRNMTTYLRTMVVGVPSKQSTAQH